MSENILENWPEGFYKLGDIKDRKNALQEAIAAGLEAPDGPLVSMWNARYTQTDHKNAAEQDSFMYAFLMIMALSENGYWLKAPMRKKLSRYLGELQLLDYANQSAEWQELLRLEYRHMAGLYISSCVGNKNYGSVLSLFPIKEAQRGRKMMESVEKALLSFPKGLGMEELSAPLYEIFCDLYQKLTEVSEG